MSAPFRVYRVEAAIGPSEVFQALRKVCGNAAFRGQSPSFEFDWIDRRVSLTANSRKGLAECKVAFLHAIDECGAGLGSFFLPGPVEKREDGRFEQPFGVALQEPAIFAQLIGHALRELGVLNVRATESEGVCRITLPPGGPIIRQIDVESLVEEFPVPEYIRIVKES